MTGFIVLDYFLYGFIYETMVVIYYYTIASINPYKAFVVSMITTILQFTIIRNIVVSDEFFLALVFYAIGCSLATAFVVFLKRFEFFKKFQKM